MVQSKLKKNLKRNIKQMAAISDYAEKLILDYLMTSGSATRPTAWYVALYTSAPSDAGGGTEL